MSFDGKLNGGDVEREIGRVLQGLSEVEAPLGLEGRVLVRVAEARGRRGVGWAPGLVLAAACGLALVVGLVSVGRREVVVHLSGGPDFARVERVGGDAVARKPPLPAARVAERRAGTAPAKTAERGRRDQVGQAFGAEERLADEEMRAPSKPEAPRPLTAQEQMLVRVAQGDGAEALARVEIADEVPEGAEGTNAEIAVKPVRKREDAVSVLRAGLFAGMMTGNVPDSSVNEE